MQAIDQEVLLALVGKTAGPAPTTKFVRSVRRQGVIVPVILREVVQDDGNITYGIIDGNRRVAAARQVGIAYIPARVLIGVTAEEAARLTLATNSFRSGNLVTELWAIRQLERSGITRKGIVGASALTSTNFRVCDRLSGLDRRVFVGFAEGKISTSAALTVSRMRDEDQRQVGDLYEARGKLLVKDLRALSKGRQKRGSTGRNAVQEIQSPHVHVVERPNASPTYEPTYDPGSRDHGSVPVTLASVSSGVHRDSSVVPTTVMGEQCQHVGSDGGMFVSVEATEPPEDLPVEESTRQAESREPVTLAHRPTAPPGPDRPDAIPDDVRIALRSVALRAIQLGIPEGEVTRMIQEVYREKGVRRHREQQPDVRERYA